MGGAPSALCFAAKRASSEDAASRARSKGRTVEQELVYDSFVDTSQAIKAYAESSITCLAKVAAGLDRMQRFLVSSISRENYSFIREVQPTPRQIIKAMKRRFASNSDRVLEWMARLRPGHLLHVTAAAGSHASPFPSSGQSNCGGSIYSTIETTAVGTRAIRTPEAASSSVRGAPAVLRFAAKRAANEDAASRARTKRRTMERELIYELFLSIGKALEAYTEQAFACLARLAAGLDPRSVST